MSEETGHHSITPSKPSVRKPFELITLKLLTLSSEWGGGRVVVYFVSSRLLVVPARGCTKTTLFLGPEEV